MSITMDHSDFRSTSRAIAFAGVCSSTLSLWAYYRAATDGAYTGFCDVSQYVNCVNLFTSSAWHVAGTPYAVWDLALFTTAGLLASGLPSLNRSALNSFVGTLALVRSGASIAMSTIAVFQLQSICPLQVTSDGLWLVIVFQARRSQLATRHEMKVDVAAQLRDLSSQVGTWLVVILLVLGVAAAMVSGPHP